MTAADARYEALAEMVERELELVASGRFEELSELAAERAALVAALPETPPPSARAALIRASLLEQRLAIDLHRGRETVLAQLAEVQRARRAARGYAPARSTTARIEASA